jgi:hypothetical protein
LFQTETLAAVIASDSEAIKIESTQQSPSLDCFALLAMTAETIRLEHILRQGSTPIGEDFVVSDANTNADVARSVLTQFVFGQGSRSVEMRRPPEADDWEKDALVRLWDDACGAKNCSGSAKKGISSRRPSHRRA